jgi:hypothetical protein
MRTSRIAGIWAALVTLAISAPVRAEYVNRTYLFDQSNVLSDGQVFGGVTIEAYDGAGPAAGGLSAGQVRLTFTADPLSIYGSSQCFGIRAIGFNTDLALQPEQIHLPDAWALRENRFMGGFGRFGWQAYTTADQQSSLVVTIDGLDSAATLDHFLIASATSTGGTPAQGSVYFACRIGGVHISNDCGPNSHVVGNGVPPPAGPIGDETLPPEPQPSPEPATGLLAIAALCGLGLRHWRMCRGL